MSIKNQLDNINIDTDVAESLTVLAYELSIINQLLEKKDYTTETFTDRTRLYDWGTGKGCDLITPCAYVFSYMNVNDIDWNDFTFEGDGIYLVYDFIFTENSVELPKVDSSDTDSVSIDILASSMAQMWNDDFQMGYAFLSFYSQLKALYLDNRQMPEFEIRKGITRGIKPYIAGGF